MESKTRVLEDGSVVYTFAEKMPEFNGSLPDWMMSAIHYPDSARAHGEQGRVVVQFVVDEHGKTMWPKVARSSGHALLDEEAVRVVNAMPDWTPAMQDGKAVPVYFTLPIGFKLD